MPEALLNFRPILAALQAANVRFVLIGGLAMSAHRLHAGRLLMLHSLSLPPAFAFIRGYTLLHVISW